MAPRSKTDHLIEIHPEYMVELRRRIETGPGLGVVAKAAGMSKMTLWRALHGSPGFRVTANTVERARAGLAFLEDGKEPLPPPVVSVRNAAHHAWIQLGESLLEEDPEALAALLRNPTAIRQAVRAARPGRAG